MREAIVSVSQLVRQPVGRVVSRLRENPMVAAALDNGEALFADPNFLRQLYLDVTSDVALGFVFSAQHNGVFSGGGWNALRENRRDILANMSVSLIETVAMDTMTFFHGRRIAARRADDAGPVDAVTMYDPHLSTTDRADVAMSMLVSNGAIGLSSGLVASLIETEHPTAESMARRMGFDASFLALHAGPREHYKIFLTQSIQRALDNRRGSPLVLGSTKRMLSMGNDAISWSQYVVLEDMNLAQFLDPTGRFVGEPREVPRTVSPDLTNVGPQRPPRPRTGIRARLYAPAAAEAGNWVSPLLE
jgi:hypothetical protein